MISWLGSLSHLGPVADLGTASYKPGEGKSPFPVCPTERRSYSQNCVVWIKNTGLHVGFLVAVVNFLSLIGTCICSVRRCFLLLNR